MANDIDVERERSRINSQIQSNNNKLQECRRTNESLDGQISRLMGARQRISEIKSQYLTIKNNENNALIKTESWKWKGKKFDEYNNNKAPNVFRETNNYYKDIDKILDAINMRISELQNQKYSDDFIGNILKSLNSLHHQLQNLFN